VPNLVSDPHLLPGLRWAVVGLALAFLGLVAGGVAIRTRLARGAEEPEPGEDATVR